MALFMCVDIHTPYEGTFNRFNRLGRLQHGDMERGEMCPFEYRYSLSSYPGLALSVMAYRDVSPMLLGRYYVLFDISGL